MEVDVAARRHDGAARLQREPSPPPDAHVCGIDGRAAWRAALVVGLASLVGALIPLAPFLLLAARLAVPAALVASATVLFAFGVYKARITLGHPLKSGLELAAIGTAAAALGYGIGALLPA